MNRLAILIVLLLFQNCSTSKVKQTKDGELLSAIDFNIFQNKKVDNIEIEIVNAGVLNISSGEIVAIDPLVDFNAKPFSKKIKPGNYPVKLYVAKTKESGERIAVAKLEFNSKKADRWVLALIDGQKTSELKKDEFFGFGVDAGLASFYDYESGIAYNKFLTDFLKDSIKNIYDDLLEKEFKKNAKSQSDPNDIGQWVNFKIPNTNHNIIMFSSGYGDGFYPAYWGVTSENEIVSLIIDFQVIENN